MSRTDLTSGTLRPGFLPTNSDTQATLCFLPDANIVGRSTQGSRPEILYGRSFTNKPTPLQISKILSNTNIQSSERHDMHSAIINTAAQSRKYAPREGKRRDREAHNEFLNSRKCSYFPSSSISPISSHCHEAIFFQLHNLHSNNIPDSTQQTQSLEIPSTSTINPQATLTKLDTYQNLNSSLKMPLKTHIQSSSEKGLSSVTALIVGFLTRRLSYLGSRPSLSFLFKQCLLLTTACLPFHFQRPSLPVPELAH